LRLARRELRGGLAGMGIFLLCLTLGVAAMAAVGALSAAIERGLAEEGRPLLGGDVDFSLVHRELGEEERAFLATGGQVSTVASLRAMARSDKSQSLVEVKAVDGAYPLYGEMALDGGQDLAAALAAGEDGTWGAAAEPGLLPRLGLEPGDRFKLGNVELELRAVIVREPDRVADGFILAPRLMIALPALGSTGLVRPGSLVHWHYRVKLAGTGEERALKAFQREARARFPDAGWRIRSRANAAPNVDRFVERVGFFLSLVALTALVVGGVGIANAVKAYLDRKRTDIAILKCLGASRRLVFLSALLQILFIAALGIGLGLNLGAALPLAAARLPEGLLPVPISTSVPWMPLSVAGLFGLLTTLAFSVWPLAEARETPPAMLFRGHVPAAGRFQVAAALVIALCILLLVGLALLTFSTRTVVGWYAGGLIASFAVLAGLARLVMGLARRHVRPASALARFAVANLYRPGAATPAVVISLGIALSLFVTLGLVDRNIRNELTAALPKQAPSFFFIDVDKEILPDFIAHLEGRPGIAAVSTAPMLRGRIVEVNGRPVEAVRPAAEAAWAIRGDRGLTYAARLPEGSRLVAGEWWPADYAGPPLVSVVDEIAEGLGLKLGDTVKVNVLGRDIEARLANLRAVEWRSLQINFVLVFTPNALSAAPHGNIVTVAMDPLGEEALMREVGERFPAVTAIRVKEALEAVDDLMGKLLAGLRAANALTFVIGIAVLAGAVITTLSARLHDVVILKTYGATRRQLLAALTIEFAALGVLTALFALLAGTAGAWVIVVFVLEMPWSFDVVTALLTVALALMVTLVAGLASTSSVLGVRPGPLLRMT
jgi:putative ABC transport system permease protein